MTNLYNFSKFVCRLANIFLLNSLLVFLVNVDEYPVEVVLFEHFVKLRKLQSVRVVGVKLVENSLELDAPDFILRLV